MKSVYLSSFVLLIWVADSLAADGDVGGKCVGDNNTCTDANAYCDDSDTRNKVCSCKAGWVRKGSKCVRGANQPCGPSECVAFGTCNDGLCGCDASLGRVPSADNSSCVCPENQVKGGKDGKCLKTIGQSCTADTECIPDAVCNAETKKCECDSTRFFLTAEDNATSCSCDLTKTIQRTAGITKCFLKFDQDCTATSECKAGDGVICDETCKCDTTKNYELNKTISACQCAADHTKRSDKTCGKNVNQDCAAGDVCTDHANCNNGKCGCDINNFWATNSGNTCFCNEALKYKLKADGSCGKVLGQMCETDSECLDHAICSLDTNTNTNKCTCDSSKSRVIGDNNKACVCNENTIEDLDRKDQMCRKKVGQPCNDVSECETTHGMVCKEVDKTKICTCDTTKHFAAGAAGDTTCSCADRDMYHLQTADGSCAIKVGKNCSSADAFCVPGAVCDKKSQLCLCDSTNNYALGSVGDIKCSCDANSKQIGNTHFCGKKIGEKCTATQTGVCTDHATCTMDMESGTSSCKCSGKTMLDGSCSVASPVVASFGVLMAGLLMVSRLI